MPQIVICPYSMKSKSAKDLADALGTTRVPDGAGLPADTVIINWGSGYSSGGRSTILNKRENVSKAVNKTLTFQYLTQAGVKTPEWTTSKLIAERWLTQGFKVVCRTITNGSSGRGIVLAHNILDLVDAPLYTKYINKDYEFRIHVFDNKVIDERQKVRASDGRAITSEYICTHSNGYVFNFANAPLVAKLEAIKAVQALGLDFGAVDLVVKLNRGPSNISYNFEPYVLEVNTAPGLQGQTITSYVNAIKRRFNQTQ